MNVAQFEAAPSRLRHPRYEESMLYTTAPEWSTGEVLLASAYRGLILGVSESDVNLDNIARASEWMPDTLERDTWLHVFMDQGGIASPRRRGQYSRQPAPQLMPVVPSVGRIAGVLGKRPRSRWNPFHLLLETIGAGVGQPAGQMLIRELGESLAVRENDDVFARFIEASLVEGLRQLQPNPVVPPPYQSLSLPEERLRAYRGNMAARRLCPAERFCKDLPVVLRLKCELTRRQWTVLVEALLRLGLGMHVLWTCNANVILWELALAVASGDAPPTSRDIEQQIWEPRGDSHFLLELGTNAEPLIERLTERYAYARTGLNLLLCRLDEAGAPWNSTIGCTVQPTMNAPAALAAFLAHVSASRQVIDPADGGRWLRTRVSRLFDETKELRALAARASGYTKNLFEFARHSLGQVNAKDPEQRCFDLAYLLAFRGDRKPLPVQLGPAMLIMLVHSCCETQSSIPMSLDDFRKHLGQFGLHVPAGELVDGRTGHDLSMLGLVVDSPDAAGGRLLVPPFG